VPLASRVRKDVNPDPDVRLPLAAAEAIVAGKKYDGHLGTPIQGSRTQAIARGCHVAR
jgi:hypothetical protein